MTTMTIIRALELINTDDTDDATETVLRNMNQQLGHPIPSEVIPQQSRMDTFARLAVECDTDDELLDVFTEAATGHLIHPAPTRADLEATYGDASRCGKPSPVTPSNYTPGSVAAYARERLGEHVEQDEVVNARGTRHTWNDLNDLQVDTNCGSDCRAAIDRTVGEFKDTELNWFGSVNKSCHEYDPSYIRDTRHDLLDDCLVFWLG